MNELTQVVMQGVLSVLVVLIGLLFKELKRFLEAKNEHLKAKTDLKQYELVKSIAKTVVEAVEQVYKDVVDDNAKRILIESVVNGMNDLKNM